MLLRSRWRAGKSLCALQPGSRMATCSGWLFVSFGSVHFGKNERSIYTIKKWPWKLEHTTLNLTLHGSSLSSLMVPALIAFIFRVSLTQKITQITKNRTVQHNNPSTGWHFGEFLRYSCRMILNLTIHEPDQELSLHFLYQLHTCENS